SSRNLGGPVVSADESGLGTPVNNPRPAGAAPCACGSEAQGAAAVAPSEGNEVRCEGRQEVGVLHSYQGSGGTDPGDPVEGGGTGSWTRSRARRRRPSAPSLSQRNSS